MRITRFQLVGLAAALAGAGAKDAEAGNVNITTATTTPLSTSAPAAPGDLTPGDVTVAAGGSIAVTAGQTAVTVNSGNNVSNAGTLASTDAINTTAISILGGNVGPNTITNSGAINLSETYVLADTDSDGDLDGAFATGTNRHGIFLQAGPTFTGNIVNTGSISVEGQNSGGIRLDARLTGGLTSSGQINLTGENSVGIAINGGAAGGVTGDVRVQGTTVRGQNSIGLLVGAPIGGDLRINGNWLVTGFHSTARPANSATLEPLDDLLIGGPAIAVHYSVAGGITLEGVGVEDDVDDDGDGLLDGTTAELNDDLSTNINVAGSAPALLIQADPSANLVLGPIATGTAAGYGLHVRGTVSASGVYDGISATAIRIEGDAGGSLTTTAHGVAIDNAVSSTAFEANAYGIYIGDNAVIGDNLLFPAMRIRRSVTSAVASQAANNAFALYFANGASVPQLSNSGILRAQYFGETGNAVVIRDLSNSLATITNSGTIQAQLIATDTDATDNIPPPPITGSAIAIDVSASTIGVTLNQIADTPFLDDDTVDDDAAGRPAVLIEGDIRFGSGADTVNLLKGSIVGDLSFGAGADTFIINNGATYTGRLTDDAGGLLTINVIDGGLNLEAGATQITSAHFGANSDFGISLSATGPSTFLEASGAVTFDVGARIVPVVPNGLPDSDSNVVFLTAHGGLTVDSGSLGAITGTGVPFIYDVNIGLVLGDPNSLEASYILKAPSALGLNANQARAFNNIIDAVQTDAAASAAMALIDSALAFTDAYEDLMPSYASGAAELATTAIQQAQSATTNRLAATRLHDVDDVSAWVQEIGYGLERTPPTANGQAFKGQGFGVAMGIDGPLDNGALFGLSASFVASEVSEPGRPEGEISAWFGQANAYLGTAMGPIDLDFIAGGGVGKMQSRRFVEIGSTFRALSEAEWWAFEGHGSVRASAPMRLADWFVITPQAALTYVALSESAYTEEGGGALDYDVDSALSQRLWGDAGVEFSTRFNLAGGTSVAPRVFAGYRTNLIDEQAERTVRFAAGGTDFTLTDEGFGDGAPLVGIGIDATNGYSTFSLSYEGEYGDQIDRHSVNAAIRFRF